MILRVATFSAALSGADLAFVAAQGAPGGNEIWEHQAGPGVENWNSKVVSLGNQGTQVFSTFGSFSDFTRLFSSFDQDPPAAIWQATSTVLTMRHRVSSAESADVHASLFDVNSGGAFNTRNVIVQKYTSSSGTPDWTYTFPIETNGHDSTAVHVSDDGLTIVAVVHDIFTNNADIAVFDAWSGVPRSYTKVSLLGPFKSTILSATGKILFLRSGIKAVLFDTTTASERHSAILFGGQVQSDAMSGDGETYAVGTNNDVKVWSLDSSGLYPLVHTFTLDTDSYCGKMAISEDGSTIALGYNYWNAWLRVRFRAFDLATGSLLMDHSVTGTGTLQNLVSALEMSADGKVFAAGLWGDESGVVPEVVVYDSRQSAPIATFDLPGSVNGLDLGDDGKHVVASCKNSHANVVSTGGRLALFDLGQRDLRLTGVPKVGSTVTFEVRADPGKHASLLMSTQPAIDPIDVVGAGKLYLDPVNTTFNAMGFVDASGRAQLDITLPNSAALVGVTLNFQGFSSSPRELTKDWIAVTVLP